MVQRVFWRGIIHASHVFVKNCLQINALLLLYSFRMLAKDKILYYITLVAGAILLIIPALINSYPLVNSDTSTYISSGFTPAAPWDRPITYGLLLYIFSIAGISMWAAVFVQGYILSWLVSLTIKNIHGKHSHVITLGTIILLSLLTSLSWVASELIADVYTGVIILCISLLIIGAESKTNKVLLYLLFFIAVATHTSHLIYSSAILVLLLLLQKRLFRHLPARATRNALLILLLLTISTISIMGACMAKSKQMFMMASLLDKGILKPSLDELCQDSTYSICKYKDNLPTSPDYFLWDDNSPMQKEGGWKTTQQEYRHIINSTLCRPKYIWMYIKSSASSTFVQLVTINIGDGNTSFPAGSNVSNTLESYLPHESNAFIHSRQNSTGIKQHLDIPNIIITIVVSISILMLVGLLYYKKHVMPDSFYVLLTIVVLGLLINAWSCATFSQVNGRYGCRTTWLLPLVAILAVTKSYFLPKKPKANR